MRAAVVIAMLEEFTTPISSDHSATVARLCFPALLATAVLVGWGGGRLVRDQSKAGIRLAGG
jgi:hypothetical protein